MYVKIFICGEKGIRTPGTFQFNGFQDRRNRPLCHLSLFNFATAKVQKLLLKLLLL